MTTESTAISRPKREDLIPGYRLETLVGKGGMGEVHKAKQLSLSRTVAIKLLSSELAKDAQFVTRFEKEAAALAALQHPHIVSIVDKGRTDDTYYLVMEFVDGPSLREVMRAPDFSTARALKITYDICRAIDYAHSKGIIHRDLKPENILFDEQAGGISKVSDFGLASFTADQGGPERFNLTETHVAMGTASYMAPEQRVDAKNADGRADIYATGIILYELLTGELPVGTFTPPSIKKEGLDKRLDAIVDRCLKPAPSDRFQTMNDLIAALEPMVPITTSLIPRKVSKAARLGLAVQRTVRNTLRAVAALILVAASAVIVTAVIRSQLKHVNIELPGAAIASELPAKSAISTSARLENSDTQRDLLLGNGPDTVPVVPYGRQLRVEGGTIIWDQPSSDALVGRAKLDISEFDGRAVTISADVVSPPPPDDLKSTIKRIVLGYGPEPKTALILTGDTGRYLALIASGTGQPVSFEWALAEKRGAMIGPVSTKVMQLSISIDRQGEARAFMGSGKDKRQIAEPVSLGRDWKKHFGRMPIAQLGCIEAACKFSAVHFEVEKEAPGVAQQQQTPVVEQVAQKEPEVVEKKQPVTKTPEKKTSSKTTTTTVRTASSKTTAKSVVDRAIKVVKDTGKTTHHK
ncbi:MAG: serine/threonine protein kinase [Myxococcaceae bacterium]